MQISPLPLDCVHWGQPEFMIFGRKIEIHHRSSETSSHTSSSSRHLSPSEREESVDRMEKGQKLWTSGRREFIAELSRNYCVLFRSLLIQCSALSENYVEHDRWDPRLHTICEWVRAMNRSISKSEFPLETFSAARTVDLCRNWAISRVQVENLQLGKFFSRSSSRELNLLWISLERICRRSTTLGQVGSRL